VIQELEATMKRVESALLIQDWDSISRIDKEINSILSSANSRSTPISNQELELLNQLGDCYQLLIASCQQEQDKIAKRLSISQKIRRKANHLQQKLDH